MPLFDPASSAVSKPGGNVVAMPDSRWFAGARPAVGSSAACAGSSCQSLFATRNAQLPSRSYGVKSASALSAPMPGGVLPGACALRLASMKIKSSGGERQTNWVL